MSWTPVIVVQDWGRIQTVFNGVDVSFYRDVVTQVRSWAVGEPFDDSYAEIFFPQISPFEALPAWLADFVNVELNLIRPDGSTKVLWEGMFASEEDSVSETGGGLSVHCIGAIFQLDLYVKPPAMFRPDPKDIGLLIFESFTSSTTINRAALRLGPPSAYATPPVYHNPAEQTHPAVTGILSTKSGSWGAALGYIQELLSQAQTADGTQWTVMKYPGRQVEILKKDRVTVHWTVHMGAPGVTHSLSRDLTMAPNAYYGEGTDADGCQWRNSKYPDELEDDYSFFMPVSIDPLVENWTYTASGKVTGTNPVFDRNKIRIERKEDVGERISKAEATVMIDKMRLRDQVPTRFGTITLTTDPSEGSRREIRAGQNILFKGHRGVNRLMHIAEAVVTNSESGCTVTLTVDEKARDLTSIQALRERDRENTDPTGRQKVTYRNSKDVEDRYVVFDCEAGGGIIPATAVTAATWKIIKVPMAETGTVVKTEFSITTPARYSVGVFDRAITAQAMSRRGPSPLDDGYWDLFDLVGQPIDGLLVAWGGAGQAMGFYPGLESETTDPLTGKFLDTGTWYFETPNPPWLWVAMWVESPANNTISGRMYPGVYA